ncbi:SDR family NAD(P)-dependent oxidoreductase [Azospirillum rugosum]|uniref:3-oxoacyl-[acyl-carrier protein] reductase n=1 Tax=Azospirillum rugosum TaxID=416170 RepID=A0ABS4SXN8_9PROT|nr:glucose 1-dehydrogenase [Azospirillum rugosum]MBP2297252.1 3-oxoacyl-[acyl-carrier protein] reductase [Azospirillum rugosum]MDQ0531094.1 3-oxoacyl-[acyl-carrier protein] reductase [Azospirillum rugosum]
MKRLEGKSALITGGASGLGRAQAIRFAEEGAAVAIADINAEKAHAVADEITSGGGTAIAVSIDVTDEKSVIAAVQSTINAFHRIEILSNTAGAFDNFAQSLDTSRELWDKIVAINLTSLYLVSNAVLPHMIANGRGVVLNITSGAGLRGGGGGAAYTSTKHGVVGFTRQLAAAYGHKGIRVNAIAPGLIDTPMVAHFSSDAGTKAGLSAKPAGRIGTAQDIANAALFLVSDEADFIHAVTLPVDGGLVEIL